jgi:hypothetical protein
VGTLANGELLTIALEIAGDEIGMVYIVRNPEKLKHVSDRARVGVPGSGLPDA